MRHRPGDEGVALLVVGVAGLQLPLGGGGAVAHAPPHPLLRVVVRQLSRHATVLKGNPLQKTFFNDDYDICPNVLPCLAGPASQSQALLE